MTAKTEMSLGNALNKKKGASVPGLDRRLIAALVVLLACPGLPPVHAEDWQPVPPEELKMTSEPNAPGAPAVMLYRQVDRDDDRFQSFEKHYLRIKVLADEGRKFGNVEIQFVKNQEMVYDIDARTIQPDGSVVKFDGTVYEKPVVQMTGYKVIAKSFTLPDVRVGSVLEYRYKQRFAYLFNSKWVLSENLFTKHARFSLVPNPRFPIGYSWPAGLPSGAAPPKEDHHKISLEARDIPAFVTEEYMPPENALKYRVDFIYQVHHYDEEIEKDPKLFWQKFGKEAYRVVNDFVDRRRAMTEAVGQIVSAGDSPEAKLRKIYDRTQRLRNTSYERNKSLQEVERENVNVFEDAGDVWKRGYGDRRQIAWLFLALVQAAGIKADLVLVSTRDQHIFDHNLNNPNDLNANVVAATLDGNTLYLDPGAALVPFGSLPWPETGVSGLRLRKDGGEWITTPMPVARDSRTERKGDLKLTASGTLEGKLTVTYTGQEAFWRRHQEHNEDDTERKQFLEDQIKGDIPATAEVELVNRPEWDSASQYLVAQFNLKVPGWAEGSGQRLLMPVGIFGGRDRRAFEHATRVHSVYFSFPRQSADHISIELPADWRVGGSPKPRTEDDSGFVYSAWTEEGAGSLQLNRALSVDAIVVKAKGYELVQKFFQAVRSGDEDQVILLAGKNTAGTH
jgi:hypothetical protein